MIPLWKRVATDKRAIIIPLAIAFVANILGYGFIVYPLVKKSVGSAEHAASAAAAKQAALRDEAQARALVTGKEKADEELAAFYDKVLPSSLTEARRMMFAPMSALADKTHVRIQSTFSAAEDKPKDLRDIEGRDNAPSNLGRLTERIVLQGDYRNVRSFIYQLETAPEFIIIDSVTLLEGEANEPQRVTFELSTYYRLRANGL
jgi:hypothetical protein